MANQDDIKTYLLSGNNSYFEQDNRNGEILMLSGVWGSGKTHFWKNEMEEELIKKQKNNNKSYIFISLYGKDSIEELQNEIYQLSYNLAIEDDNNIISSAYSVFTKVTNFMPKVSTLEVELDKSTQKLNAENLKQQIEKGISHLKNGAVICFDDFERKSSKLDLNDLFGFITNLTEVFKTKTVIITNQEYFQENDSEIFTRIKEKSVNKFIFLDPTINELFETIYKEKYSELDEYKSKILEAIKITEEKNARIFIQVLDNCLEYKKCVKDEYEIFMLVLIIVLFVKYNLIFRMKIHKNGEKQVLLPSFVDKMPITIIDEIVNLKKENNLLMNKEKFADVLEGEVSRKYKLQEDLKYISINKNMLFQVYKYCIKTEYFKKEDKELIEKLNDFVESGILK